MNSFLDSCYVLDKKVMHDVSPIKCDKNNNIGIRDMLILDFNPISKEII